MEQILSTNKKSTFNYTINEVFYAGVVLTGSEVKMVRRKKYHFNETFCYVKDGELWIKNFYIDEHERSYIKHNPKRDKKLLLKKKELKKIGDFFKIKSNVVIPMTLFLNERNLIKIKIGLGVGKKMFDKREDLKKKEMKRDMERIKTTKGQ